ncbi:hypothetical protein, partial [Streptomyces sp. NPDC047976]|uniref:hypothetical protein n=1 Tax=Streptomyces sp. NPDC047976 TaxID=3155746 RepID=UPI0034145D94
MNTIRTTTVAAAGIAAAAGLLALAAAPASAAAPHGCASSSVCFYLKKTDYDANRPTATYRDVTSGFVTLGARGKGAKAVVNNRGGRVQIRYLNKMGGIQWGHADRSRHEGPNGAGDCAARYSVR